MHRKTIHNPDNEAHFMRLKPVAGVVSISRSGVVLAESANACWLLETGHDIYDPMLYLPAAALAVRLDPVAGKSTHCPLKGDASYLSYAGSEIAWRYDRPLPGAGVLADLVAFDPREVTITLTGDNL
ncbi:DUF427 domain-containing protein [Pseudohoeflea coraliihabitans]|uniref:DUF427 domain-containing protein n=1 Tax=Pseudohoeflea coraliihabitans TaxID=2860393 RepID=A0ABS6WSK7_9HYPH|nr:DUF427 domain-containing protein [Pseudohoeflea sp. DP4N28-3]MBW3098932.1 DUF427 domain-containing protein [Pseudohoeflea sp. DP4N28-3]